MVRGLSVAGHKTDCAVSGATIDLVQENSHVSWHLFSLTFLYLDCIAHGLVPWPDPNHPVLVCWNRWWRVSAGRAVMAVALRRVSLQSGTPLLHHQFSFLPGFEGLQTRAVLEGRPATQGNAARRLNGADFVGVTVVPGVLANLHPRHWRNCPHGRR